jgi:hypothetical protein
MPGTTLVRRLRFSVCPIAGCAEVGHATCFDEVFQYSNLGQKMFCKALFTGLSCCLAVSFVEAEMPEREKTLVSALMSREADYLQRFETGVWEMAFRSEYTSEASRVEVDGVAIWKGDNLRIDYQWQRQGTSEDNKNERTKRRGTVLKTGEDMVDYYRGREIAFRSLDGAKSCSEEFLVLPKQNWFMYAFEFPYSDLWSDNGEWAFESRDITSEKEDGRLIINISVPGEDSGVRGEFREGDLPLVSKVEHRLRGNTRYSASLEWAISEGILFPKVIAETRYDRDGSPWREWNLKIASLKPQNSTPLPSGFFTERGIGITTRTRVTTYRKNRRPVTEAATKQSDLEKAIETLRNSRFLKSSK